MSRRNNNEKANEYTDDYMRIPIIKSKFNKFKDFFYNPEKKTVLGKNRKQWGITGLFYLVFFSALAALFAACMAALMATVSTDRPRWTLDQSLIGTNPGLGFRPISENPHELALIFYKSTNQTQREVWINRLDDYLKNYINKSSLSNGGVNHQICSYEFPNLKSNHVCDVNLQKDFGNCTSEKQYGFNNSSPCIFIKLNKIFDWVPDYYEPSELPDDMPADLVKHIKSYSNKSELNTVWVSCQGEEAEDRESLGPITYYPKIRGFPGYYYPYKNIPGYLSPLVAVKFERPERNKIINVECRAWAKNIKFHQRQKIGMVHFELRIDD
ncbi:sodium/potassium-transporting ATPase subunit beta-2-like [Microplitis mediator]|uniref:sodium/potassium-transporting ATPase subunit beta-2-like n=1 Tax=Microplitis mediator TaxID=375433 RepID=UPI00255354B2|nr:sodium/potassium-transporting ATPase subunit beta-2-like [Microplitis mediator]